MGTVSQSLALAFQYHKSGDLHQAEKIYRRILQAYPLQVDALHHLGVIATQRGQHDLALSYIGKAIALNPHHAPFYSNLGCAYEALDRFSEAAECFQKAVHLKPDYAEAIQNLGTVLQEQGQLDEAVACYQQALRLEPDYVAAHFSLALCWLLMGNFADGWRDYEWRWKRNDALSRSFDQPRWDGSPLAGRTILLHAEQGLGDMLQFIRYAPLVKQQGPQVVVECQEPLAKLLATCPGIDLLVARGTTLPRFDLHAPLMSLPGILGTSLAKIPADVPYLFANSGLIDEWRHELREIDKFKIGIAWHGNPKNTKDRRRSIPLVHFAPLARLAGVRLFSLQKGLGREELRAIDFPVTDLGSRLDATSGAFMDTAAVMKNLDLVITSDTAIAHLGGALGVPVWVALPFAPDWRWLLGRDGSPWYPTMRLFRQQKLGDWGDVFEHISQALQERLALSESSGSSSPGGAAAPGQAE